MTIPTWQQRCETHADHQDGMVTNAMIQQRMQQEIDDLRAALVDQAAQARREALEELKAQCRSGQCPVNESR